MGRLSSATRKEPQAPAPVSTGERIPMRLSAPLPRCTYTPALRFIESAWCLAEMSASAALSMCEMLAGVVEAERSWRAAVTTMSSAVVDASVPPAGGSPAALASGSINAAEMGDMRISGGRLSPRTTILATVPMNKKAGKAALLAAISLLISPGTPAQDAAPQSEPSRPRIGLVLSGGGARGAAHIGVLKVLEENRVPVDA